MLEIALVGVVVVVTGVVEASASRRQRGWSAVSLLRQGVGRLHSFEAAALRAEFRRSGVAFPEPSRAHGLS